MIFSILPHVIHISTASFTLSVSNTNSKSSTYNTFRGRPVLNSCNSAFSTVINKKEYNRALVNSHFHPKLLSDRCFSVLVMPTPVIQGIPHPQAVSLPVALPSIALYQKVFPIQTTQITIFYLSSYFSSSCLT